MKNIDELRKLIIENPELDIIPFIADDANCVDYSYTVGSIGRVRVDEYVVNPYNDKNMLTKSCSYDNFADDYCEHLGKYDIPDDEIKEAYNKLGWTKAIFVYVEAYNKLGWTKAIFVYVEAF